MHPQLLPPETVIWLRRQNVDECLLDDPSGISSGSVLAESLAAADSQLEILCKRGSSETYLLRSKKSGETIIIRNDNSPTSLLLNWKFCLEMLRRKGFPIKDNILLQIMFEDTRLETAISVTCQAAGYFQRKILQVTKYKTDLVTEMASKANLRPQMPTCCDADIVNVVMKETDLLLHAGELQNYSQFIVKGGYQSSPSHLSSRRSGYATPKRSPSPGYQEAVQSVCSHEPPSRKIVIKSEFASRKDLISSFKQEKALLFTVAERNAMRDQLAVLEHRVAARYSKVTALKQLQRVDKPLQTKIFR